MLDALPKVEERPASSSSSVPSPAVSPGLQGILKTRPSTNGLLSPQLSVQSSRSGTGTPISAALSRSSTNNSHYVSRVAFDLLDGEGTKTGGGTGIDFSFTLHSKSIGYQRVKHSREFLVATDLNEYSTHALFWLLENLVEDGDEVVIVRVVEPGCSSRPWTDPLAQDEARAEAQKVMDSVMETNEDERQISIVVEFAVGRAEPVIQRMIQIYRPDSVVVGTRGRPTTGWKASLMGSTSRYMLEKSPVPVVVVRPERKVKRDIEHRRADPKRNVLFGESAQSSRSSSPVRPEIERAKSDEQQRGHVRRSSQLTVPKPKGFKIHRVKTAPA